MFAQGEKKDLTTHIKIKEEEPEVDELDVLEDIEAEVVLDQADIFKKKEIAEFSKKIGLTIEEIPANPSRVGKRGKGRKPNKNRGRKCTPAQLEHLRKMRLKSAAMSKENIDKRKAKKKAEADHVKDLEAKIEALVTAGRSKKKKKTKEEKHAKLMNILDAHDARRKKRKAAKPKIVRKPVPHPNRRVPIQHRPTPPPEPATGPFAGLFGYRTAPRRGWRQ